MPKRNRARCGCLHSGAVLNCLDLLHCEQRQTQVYTGVHGPVDARACCGYTIRDAKAVRARDAALSVKWRLGGGGAGL